MQLCVVMTMVFRDWKYQSPVKRKCHFYEGFAVGCSESCHFDNFGCILWPKFRQSDDISFSMIISEYIEHNFELTRLLCYLFKDRGNDNTKWKNIHRSEWHTRSFRWYLHMGRKRDCRLYVNISIGIISQWKVNVTGWLRICSHKFIWEERIPVWQGFMYWRRQWNFSPHRKRNIHVL